MLYSNFMATLKTHFSLNINRELLALTEYSKDNQGNVDVKAFLTQLDLWHPPRQPDKGHFANTKQEEGDGGHDELSASLRMQV
jgi:hypothetical protein